MKTAAKWIASVLFFFASVSLASAATVPAKPIGILATAGNAQVKVVWNPVVGATSYNVYYGTSSTITKVTGTQVPNATSGSWVTGLTNGTTYYFMVTALNATGESAVSVKVAAHPSLPHALSGTVSGANSVPVTILVTGNGMHKNIVTAANGSYSVTGLFNANYTLTPSLPGYTFTPGNIPVTMSGAAVTGQNFVAASAVPSYSITGTVSYAGLKSGPIFLRVYNCTGCTNPIAGKYIPSRSSGSVSYTIRGLQPGTYTVAAEMDTLGTGQKNDAVNPKGVSASVIISGANVTGAKVVLADPTPPALVQPTGLRVYPSSGAALIFWNPTTDASGTEIASAYKIYWGTDAAATTGTPITVTADTGGGPYIQKGLTDGTVLYYKIAELVGTNESAPSAVAGPVTIGARTGANTVSGTVTFTGTATGSMGVGLFNNATGAVRFTTFASPVSPQSYTITGVPNGSYFPFVVIDMNNDGVIGDGDITNTNGNGGGNITVAGNMTGVNIAPPSTNSAVVVNTDHQFDSTYQNHSYNLVPQIYPGLKRPVAVTLASGANLPMPLDMGSSWGFQSWFWIGATSPVVGDKYVFHVTYSDGTTETVSASVTGVSNAFVQNPVVQATTPGTATVPLFTWMAPATPPAGSYSYSLGISGSDANWWYPNNSRGIPSTTLSVLYNADGGASSPALTLGNSYWWQVQVKDATGNTASYTGNYTP